MESSNPRGDFLVLPNMKLKVLIEAIRMVLGVIYDKKFASFCFGGRHAAIRYLKNSVENPTWWFTVGFHRQDFNTRNIDKLCSFMGDRISDGALIEVIKKLFESGVVSIQLGGCFFGRGFPQESGLSSILLNVYLDGFDREFQEKRVQRSRENPVIEIGPRENENGVFFKPMKIHAVRYLDEILVVTSGPKSVATGLRKWAVEYFEERLELKVDGEKMAIHSTVSETIEFVGMVLQAVRPSVLHPPMSEKAVRARKKHLRQREVEAMERRNARERTRKILGAKIMKHCYRKAKRNEGRLEMDFRVEDEVRQVFAGWGEESTEAFLGSLDERWAWHRALTSGDFLSLGHIREKLPRGLVESYDAFQREVEKHLSPAEARRGMEAEERRREAEEERKAAADDLTRLVMKVEAPMEAVRKAVRLAGFMNELGRPRPVGSLVALEDADLVKWYAGIARQWLDFFSCCHNFAALKTTVTYHLRFSCLLTLAEKHGSTKANTIRHFTKDLKVSSAYYFPTEKEVKMMGDRKLITDPKPVDAALSLALVRLATDEPAHRCAAHFCGRTDTTVYRVRLLLGEHKCVRGLGAIHNSFHRKCLPLCPDHIHAFYMGTITLQDVDCSSIIHLD